MNAKRASGAWLVAQCEPLLATLDRVVTDEAMVAAFVSDPAWCSWWFAGVLSDQVRSLPPADPWRRLPARAGAHLTRGVSVAVPATTGARGAHGEFGTVDDGRDLVAATFGDAPIDLGLAALSSGLSAGGAAMLAFAADGWERTALAVLAIRSEHLASTADEVMVAGRIFEDCSGALRWAAWRRRAYQGRADDWLLVSGFAWMWRADELSTSGVLPAGEAAEVDRALAAEAIDPALYGLLADDGS